MGDSEGVFLPGACAAALRSTSLLTEGGKCCSHSPLGSQPKEQRGAAAAKQSGVKARPQRLLRCVKTK